MNSIKDLYNKLENSKSVALITHVRPDGDAIGSILSMKQFIVHQFNKKPSSVKLYIDGDISSTYYPLIKEENFNRRRLRKFDLAICLDIAKPELMGSYLNIFTKANNTINIDHHETNTKFAQNNIVYSKACSTCEVLFSVFNQKDNFELDEKICKLLYVGIITDTNCLTNNVGKNTHRVLAKLFTKEVDYEALRNYFFKNNSKSKINLLQKALKNLKFFENDQIALFKLSYNDFQSTGATFDDSLGIIDHAMNIGSVQIAIAIFERELGEFYVSLRSKNLINVANIAAEFQGGGHYNMAAFTYRGDITDFKTKLVNCCKEFLHSTNIGAEDWDGILN